MARPEEFPPHDPQIRSLGGAIEIIEVCYRKTIPIAPKSRLDLLGFRAPRACGSMQPKMTSPSDRAPRQVRCYKAGWRTQPVTRITRGNIEIDHTSRLCSARIQCVLYAW